MTNATSGMFVFTAGGKLLAPVTAWTGDDAVLQAIRNQLKSLVRDFKPEENPVVPPRSAKSQKEWDAAPKLPQGGLVLHVTWKVIEGFEAPKTDEEKIWQKSLGLNRVWVRKDEAQEPTKGQLRGRLRKPSARGFPFENKLELSLRQGRLSGLWHCKGTTQDKSTCGYEADVLGFIDSKDGKVTRFDVVARGPFSWQRA